MLDITNQLAKAARFISSPLRVLPDFIVIGAQRSGTTYLYNLLQMYPAILPAFRKEVHFFDKNFFRGLAWYRALFPTILEKVSNNATNSCRPITGETSSYYLFHQVIEKDTRMTDISLDDFYSELYNVVYDNVVE